MNYDYFADLVRTSKIRRAAGSVYWENNGCPWSTALLQRKVCAESIFETANLPYDDIPLSVLETLPPDSLHDRNVRDFFRLYTEIKAFLTAPFGKRGDAYLEAKCRQTHDYIGVKEFNLRRLITVFGDDAVKNNELLIDTIVTAFDSKENDTLKRERATVKEAVDYIFVLHDKFDILSMAGVINERGGGFEGRSIYIESFFKHIKKGEIATDGEFMAAFDCEKAKAEESRELNRDEKATLDEYYSATFNAIVDAKRENLRRGN